MNLKAQLSPGKVDDVAAPAPRDLKALWARAS